MDDPRRADASGLPTCDAVMAAGDRGFITLVPMLAAWRVAWDHDFLPLEAFRQACQGQVSLIRAEIARHPPAATAFDLLATLALYETALAEGQQR